MEYARRIAVPITARTMEGALYEIDKASEVADIVELRMDYIADPDPAELVKRSKLPVIATCRHKSEGGQFFGHENDRRRYLQGAADAGARYVDVEMKNFLRIDKGGASLIVSYHNFKRTPYDLAERYAKMVNMGADIPKLATLAVDRTDAIRMLEFVKGVRKGGKEVIGVCMGDAGFVTRVLGPIAGSHLGYASLEKGKESAPGQITAKELRDYWKVMGLP